MAASITLQKSDNSAFTVQTSLKSQVHELKTIAARKLQKTESELLIMFCGEDLDNGKTLESYFITSGATLQLEFSNEKIPLMVSLPNGENIVVSVKRSAAKAEVMQAIRASKSPSIPPRFDLVVGADPWVPSRVASTVPRDENVMVVAQADGGDR